MTALRRSTISSPAGEPTWDELCAATPAEPPRDLDADCVAGITYTGGTTGLPKGVMQTHGNLMANAKHLLWANPLYADDRFLHITPMFHSAGVAKWQTHRTQNAAGETP